MDDRGEPSRGAAVQGMFGSVAARYDLLNSLLSLNLHHWWRGRAAQMCGIGPNQRVLDICAGTGDFAMTAAQRVGSAGYVVGLDFCAPMLMLGIQKSRRRGERVVNFARGDAQQLPFADGSFHHATVGFGIRNVVDIGRAFSEACRVVSPGGSVCCLEFAPPSGAEGALVRAYEATIVPAIGGLLSRGDAYRYLRDTIRRFHTPEELKSIMVTSGLTDVRYLRLFPGAVCVHVGRKP